jgi:diadenosine tetraphosphate (Ap4A) HIT family hydrolase
MLRAPRLLRVRGTAAAMVDLSEWRCRTCGFHLYVPIQASLRTSHLGLYSDARFPGRALLALDRHVTSLEELDDAERDALWADAVTAGRAIRRATSCARINYAVLGNAEPHLHVHLVPRRPELEPLPTRPPWNDTRPLSEMNLAALRKLQATLEDLLR